MDDKHAEYDYLGTLPDGFTYRLAEFKGDQYRAVFLYHTKDHLA